MTTNETAVASPPRIAKSGQSTLPMLRLGRARPTRSSSSAGSIRSRMIEAWATVNENVAPNA